MLPSFLKHLAPKDIQQFPIESPAPLSMTFQYEARINEAPVREFFKRWAADISESMKPVPGEHIYERTFGYGIQQLENKKRKRFYMTEGPITYVYKNRREYKRLHHMRPYISYPVSPYPFGLTVKADDNGKLVSHGSIIDRITKNAF